MVQKLKNLSLYIFLGLLAYMPLHIFLSTWLGTSFGSLEAAKIFKDVVLVIGFLCAVTASIGQPWLKKALKDRIVWIIAAYAALTFFLALIKPTDQDAEILGIVYNLRFLLFFLYGYLLVNLYDKNILNKALKVVLGAAVIVTVFGVVQYLLLPNSALESVGYSRANGVLPAFFIDNKPDLERIMSTLRDPNSFGSYLIIILSFALVYLLKIKDRNVKKIMLGIVVLSTLCLWFTFSRSAWIGALLAMLSIAAFYIKEKRKFRINPKLIAVLCVVSVLALAMVYSLRNTYFVKNVIFHADESTVLEDPNELRVRFWQESIEAAVEEPLGYGPGTAGLASIRNEKQGTILNENYYFQILHEAGFLGLLLFLSILFVLALRLYGEIASNPTALALLAALIGLLFTNFLVHIWSNEAVAFTWWGLAGILFYRGNSHNKKAPKN